MKTLTLLSAGLLCAVSSYGAIAYGITFNDQLVTFDTTNPTSLTTYSITGLQNANIGLTDIAVRAGTTEVYGLDGDYNFYRFGANAALTLIQSSAITGSTGFTGGFSWDDFSNAFVYANDAGQMWTLTTAGVATLQTNVTYNALELDGVTSSPLSGTNADVAALAIDEFTGEAFFFDYTQQAVAVSFDGNDLSSIALLGSTNIGLQGVESIGALDVAPDGTLYGVFTEDAFTSSFYRIDRSTGAATELADFGTGISTFAVVPEPSAAAGLIALAAAVLARRRA